MTENMNATDEGMMQHLYALAQAAQNLKHCELTTIWAKDTLFW